MVAPGGIRRFDAKLRRRDESVAWVVLGRAQEPDERELEGVGGSHHGVHQRLAHALALILRKHRDRAQADDEMLADGRFAAHHVTDELAVPHGDERQRRDDVAGADQLVDERHFDRSGRRFCRHAEGFRVNPPHRLAIGRLVPSNEHR